MNWNLEGYAYDDGDNNLLDRLYQHGPRMYKEFTQLMNGYGLDIIPYNCFIVTAALQMGFVGEIDLATGALDGRIVVDE